MARDLEASFIAQRCRHLQVRASPPRSTIARSSPSTPTPPPPFPGRLRRLFQACRSARCTWRLSRQPIPHHAAPLPPVSCSGARAAAALLQWAVHQLLRRAAGGRHCIRAAALRCNGGMGMRGLIRLVATPRPPTLFLSLSLCRVTCLWQRCCGCFPRQQKRRLGDAAGGQPDAAGGLVRGAARMVLCARRWLHKEILADFIQQGGVRGVCAGAQRPQRRAGPRHARLLRRGERECAGEANRQGSAAATRGGVGACEGWMGSGGSSSS